MFTVLIAEKEYLDSIQEYDMFLRPFLDQTQVALCEWKPGRDTLETTVPSLLDTITGHEAWRAVIICNDEGLARKNPFDLVTRLLPRREEFGTEAEYLERVCAANCAAYETAAAKPLPQLITRLCPWPKLTSAGTEPEEPEMAEYAVEERKKQELRERIVAGDKWKFSLPREVLCVAKRTYENMEYDIPVSWQTRQEQEYSDFYERNLYLDRMRYLVFDLLPVSHKNYVSDLIRFLGAVLLLCNNPGAETPLAPNRVYILECENDEEALSGLMLRYDAKLRTTAAEIEEQVLQLEAKPKKRLTNQEAEALFCADTHIPVTYSGEVRRGELLVSPKGLGLSTDCPTEEEDRWGEEYRRSRKLFRKFFKEPRRALRRAVEELGRRNRVDNELAQALNEFQLEDVEEFVHDEEAAMLSIVPDDLYDLTGYYDRLDGEDRETRQVIFRRMTRCKTAALGGIALAVFLLGFVPMFLRNYGSELSPLPAVLIMLASVACLAGAFGVMLFVMRRKLVKRYLRYNREAGAICEDVDHTMQLYSRYLSHTCNVMRGFSVLNYHSVHEDPDVTLMKVYRKHLADIRVIREELWSSFGQFMGVPSDEGDRDGSEERYEYDFTRPITYPYPIPYRRELPTRVEFINPGQYVMVPVDYIRRISVRREELYD